MSVLIQLLQDPDSCFLRFSCLRTLKVYYSKLLFYRPEAMQLCMEERVIEAVSLTPSPPPEEARTCLLACSLSLGSCQKWRHLP